MPTRTVRLREAIKNIADSDAAERQRQGLQDVPVGSSQNPSTKILTVANVITFCRLALTLVFLALFIRHEHRVAALACYAVAAVTDFLDGQIARRTQTVSWLGKIMDPVMDRVLLFTGVLGLLYHKKNETQDDVEALVQQRQEARKAKNWKEADRIRDLIISMGYILEDTPQGAKVRKA